MKRNFTIQILTLLLLSCSSKSYPIYTAYCEESTVIESERESYDIVLEKTGLVNSILTGKVIFKEDQDSVIGAKIILKENESEKEIISFTNLKGEFALIVDPGEYSINIKYVGLTQFQHELILKQEELSRIEVAMGTGLYFSEIPDTIWVNKRKYKQYLNSKNSTK